MDHQAVSTVRLPLETECLTGPGSAKQTDAHEAQVVRILDGRDEQINLLRSHSVYVPTMKMAFRSMPYALKASENNSPSPASPARPLCIRG